MADLSSSFLYGRGVFTTVAIHNFQPFLWEKHWRRLSASAAKLEIDVSEIAEETVLPELRNEIQKNNLKSGRARVAFSDQTPSEIWGKLSEKKTGLSIITAGPRKVPDNSKLTISPHHVNTTSPLAGIKSCNYLEHLMAYDNAKNRGFDEAIRLNEHNEIASGCMSNVFWLTNEKLYTPSLSTGCLPGTTREFVLENLECEEVEVGIHALDEAGAIFLTSAGVGVVEVAEFEGRQLVGRDHPILDLLPKAEPQA